MDVLLVGSKFKLNNGVPKIFGGLDGVDSKLEGIIGSLDTLPG